MTDQPLTPSQREIITFPVDPTRTLRIVSGPGAGKSTTIVHKLAYLINNDLVTPDKILVLSMTNRAVDSMKQKLAETIGEQMAQTIHIHTFHALSHILMTQNDESFQNVEVLNEPGWTVLSELMKMNKYRLRDCITRAKSRGGDDKAIEDVAREFGVNARVLKKALDLLNRMHTIIHSDFLRGAKSLLKDGDAVLEYDITIVDEFQDMYQDLWEFVQLISKDTHLVVAGDPCQSIYNFLGSNAVVEKELEDFKPVDTVAMSESFRSTPQIVIASEKMLGVERNLSSIRPPSVKPVLTIFNTLDDQFQYISDEILRLTCSSNNEIQYRDIAILARTNSELQTMAKTLSFYHIPYLKLSSTPTWLDNELSNLINYLNVLYRPERAHWSIVCTLKLLPGVGPVMVSRLEEESRKLGISLYTYLSLHKSELKTPIQEYIDLIESTRDTLDFHSPQSIMKSLLHIGNELGLRKLVSKSVNNQMDKNHITRQLLDFYENIKMFASLRPADVSVAEYFLQNYLDLVPLSRKKDAVRLSTIHSAKGLEFPIVFLLAGEKFNSESFEDRKLQYVGMTRAQGLLYVNVFDRQGKWDEGLLKRDFGGEFQFEAPDVDDALVGVLKGRDMKKGFGGVRHFHTLARPKVFNVSTGVTGAGIRQGFSLIRRLIHR